MYPKVTYVFTKLLKPTFSIYRYLKVFFTTYIPSREYLNFKQ